MRLLVAIATYAASCKWRGQLRSVHALWPQLPRLSLCLPDVERVPVWLAFARVLSLHRDPAHCVPAVDACRASPSVAKCNAPLAIKPSVAC